MEEIAHKLNEWLASLSGEFVVEADSVIDRLTTEFFEGKLDFQAFAGCLLSRAMVKYPGLKRYEGLERNFRAEWKDYLEGIKETNDE